eukprot:10105985-Lingulodinium_polyedra.AAC.1
MEDRDAAKKALEAAEAKLLETGEELLKAQEEARKEAACLGQEQGGQKQGEGVVDLGRIMQEPDCL